MFFVEPKKTIFASKSEASEKPPEAAATAAAAEQPESAAEAEQSEVSLAETDQNGSNRWCQVCGIL